MTQLAKILVDDPSPSKRYRKGDVVDVLHHRQRLSDKHRFHFTVQLQSKPSLDGRGLSTIVLLHQRDVELIGEQW